MFWNSNAQFLIKKYL